MSDDAFVAPELQPLVEKWGRYAPPAAEAQAITFEQYMAWTPEECNKMELVDGRPLIGGQDDGVERMLAFLLRAVGLRDAVRLASAEAWRRAVEWWWGGVTISSMGMRCWSLAGCFSRGIRQNKADRG